MRPNPQFSNWHCMPLWLRQKSSVHMNSAFWFALLFFYFLNVCGVISNEFSHCYAYFTSSLTLGLRNVLKPPNFLDDLKRVVKAYNAWKGWWRYVRKHVICKKKIVKKKIEWTMICCTVYLSVNWASLKSVHDILSSLASMRHIYHYLSVTYLYF